jgi:hypothetical protein
VLGIILKFDHVPEAVGAAHELPLRTAVHAPDVLYRLRICEHPPVPLTGTNNATAVPKRIRNFLIVRTGNRHEKIGDADSL